MELQIGRRYSNGWFGTVSYVYSKLYGNYAGLQSTDEIRAPTIGTSFPGDQQYAGQSYRPGGNANRYFDLDEILYDANGNVGVEGRLPTDRPHVFKLYGDKSFSCGTELGTFFRGHERHAGDHAGVDDQRHPELRKWTRGRGTDAVLHADRPDGGAELQDGRDEDAAFRIQPRQSVQPEDVDVQLPELQQRGARRLVGDRPEQMSICRRASTGSRRCWTRATARSPSTRVYGKGALFNPGFQGRFLVKFIF